MDTNYSYNYGLLIGELLKNECNSITNTWISQATSRKAPL
jgi:hypothetical protein